MDAKKIGILVDELHSGGVEKIALHQVDALSKQQAEVSLVVLRRIPLDNHPFGHLIKTIPIIYLDDRLPSWLKFSFKLPFFSFFSLFHLTYPLLIPFVVKKGEFDILVSHGTYTTFTASSLKIFKEINFVLMLWDPIYYILKKAYVQGPIYSLRFILLPLAKLIDKILTYQADAVLVAGGAHRDYLRTLGVNKIKVLYPGVEPIRQIGREKKNYILTVTSWNKGKQPLYNLDIIEAVPEAKLVLAGSWHPAKLESQVREEISKRGLQDRVEVTGSVSEERLRTLYSEARVFLQTNDDRGFGMAALEAAACGCVFLIPSGQGVGELFSEGAEGFFTKERDTQEIISKLKNLYQNNQLSQAMGERGWKKVVAHYSWEKHGQRLLKIIDDLK